MHAHLCVCVWGEGGGKKEGDDGIRLFTSMPQRQCNASQSDSSRLGHDTRENDFFRIPAKDGDTDSAQRFRLSVTA